MAISGPMVKGGNKLAIVRIFYTALGGALALSGAVSSWRLRILPSRRHPPRPFRGSCARLRRAATIRENGGASLCRTHDERFRRFQKYFEGRCRSARDGAESRGHLLDRLDDGRVVSNVCRNDAVKVEGGAEVARDGAIPRSQGAPESSNGFGYTNNEATSKFPEAARRRKSASLKMRVTDFAAMAKGFQSRFAV